MLGEQTTLIVLVNLWALATHGSNPALPTTRTIVERASSTHQLPPFAHECHGMARPKRLTKRNAMEM